MAFFNCSIFKYRYVLDLVGLASEEALYFQQTRNTSEWIDTLSRKHNVELAMIYEDWFSVIPKSWIKIADLHLGKIKLDLIKGSSIIFPS